MTPLPPRGVLTLALGPALYWELACNLSRSVRHWHPDGSLPVTIVTDQPRKLPPDLATVRLHQVAPDELGRGFEAKLHLDRLAPAAHTLFIDADCLVYASLHPVFALLAGHPVATFGHEIAAGEWFGDVATLCARIGVPAIPKFNGGVYYLEPGPPATEVFQTARGLKPRYDELGLVRLRGRPNDELLIAAAMARHGLHPMPDDATILSDPQCCPGPLRVSVLRGRRRLHNPPPPSSLHRAWYPFTDVSPAIVHFLGDYTSGPAYRADALRLALAARRLPPWAATPAASLLVVAPGTARTWVKNLLRPVFHRCFGVRGIRPSSRLS